MRKTLAFMVAALALLQVWSVIGQEMQESLSLDSEVNVTATLDDFMNESNNGTDNDTQAVDLIDTNLSTTSSQSDFLDMPVNQSLIDANLSTTASQNAFLEVPVNSSLIDASIGITGTMMEFLTGEPVAAETPFYAKHQMMGSGANDSEAEQAPSFYKKHQMMGT